MTETTFVQREKRRMPKFTCAKLITADRIIESYVIISFPDPLSISSTDGKKTRRRLEGPKQLFSRVIINPGPVLAYE